MKLPCFPQNMVTAQLQKQFSALMIIRSVSPPAIQIKMMFEGTCDTEDWSNAI